MTTDSIQQRMLFRALGAQAALLAYPQASDAGLTMQAEQATAFITQFASSPAKVDATDTEEDFRILGVKAPGDTGAPATEQQGYAQLALAAEALGRGAAFLEAHRARREAIAASTLSTLSEELSAIARTESEDREQSIARDLRLLRIVEEIGRLTATPPDQANPK